MRKKPEGEIQFDKYLHSAGIRNFDAERTFPGSSRTPDYSFTHEGSTLLLDVKDFVPEASDFEFSCGAYDPYVHIRKKIDEGKRKFKNLKDYACALVLYNRGKPLVDLSPEYLYASMLGNIGISFPMDMNTGIGDVEKTTTIFGPKGKMLEYGKGSIPVNTRNSTISAIIALGFLHVGQGLCSAAIDEQQRQLGRHMTMRETLKAAKDIDLSDKRKGGV